MNKSEFLEVLGQKLSEELSRGQVISNLQYYESYIIGAMQGGKSEQEVLEELGDPNMIARTILDAQTGEAFNGQQFAEDADYTQTETSSSTGERTTEKDSGTGYSQAESREYTGYSKQDMYEDAGETQAESGQKGGGYQVRTNHGCLIIALILIAIVVAVVSIVGSVISFLWPVLVPVLVILLVLSIFKDRRR